MPNRIKELREEFHMTQTRLSIELGVSQETISAYEKEKHYPGFHQLVNLSDLFHASIDYIMGRSDVRIPAGAEERPKLSKLVSLANHLNDNQVDLLLAYTMGILTKQ